MSVRALVLLVVAALAGVALVVPAAGAGAGDVQAIRTLAARYTDATTTGSPLACQLMTPRARPYFISIASRLTKSKLATCPDAVKAVAKLNETFFPSHAAYLRANAAEARAIAHGKVTIKGAYATLDVTVANVSSNMNFALVQSRWLVDG
jgi:hypothetical protein